jgi:hypothetical protein
MLEILTRHFARRPNLLAVQQASLARQSSRAWKQTLLIDEVGRGVAWANAQLANHAPAGDYVWILDDDDECICDTWIGDLHLLIEAHDPDVVWVKNDVHGHGVIPEPDYWQNRPVFAHIAMSCFVVKRVVYLRHAHAFRRDVGADCSFAQAVYDATQPYRQLWHECTVMRTQRVSRGQPE